MEQTGEFACKAGQPGVCAHVGAQLVTRVTIRDDCTSQSCQWKAASTGNIELEPKRCSNMMIYNLEKDNVAKLRPYAGV